MIGQDISEEDKTVNHKNRIIKKKFKGSLARKMIRAKARRLIKRLREVKGNE